MGKFKSALDSGEFKSFVQTDASTDGPLASQDAFGVHQRLQIPGPARLPA